MLLLDLDLGPLFLSLLIFMVGVSLSVHTWWTRIFLFLHDVVGTWLQILRLHYPLLTSESLNILDGVGEGFDGQ